MLLSKLSSKLYVQAYLFGFFVFFQTSILLLVCKFHSWKFQPVTIKKKLFSSSHRTWFKSNFIVCPRNSKTEFFSFAHKLNFILLELPADLSEDAVVKTAAQFCQDLLQHIPVIIITLGRYGLLLAERHVSCRLYFNKIWYIFMFQFGSLLFGISAHCCPLISGSLKLLETTLISGLVLVRVFPSTLPFCLILSKPLWNLAPIQQLDQVCCTTGVLNSLPLVLDAISPLHALLVSCWSLLVCMNIIFLIFLLVFLYTLTLTLKLEVGPLFNQNVHLKKCVNMWVDLKNHVVGAIKFVQRIIKYHLKPWNWRNLQTANFRTRQLACI